MAFLASQVDPESVGFRLNKAFIQTADRVYWLYYDVADSDVYVAQNLPPGIAMYSADPDQPFYRVVDLEVRIGAQCKTPDGTKYARRWTAAVAYGPWTDLLDSPDGNPLNQPLRYSIDATRITKPFIEDIETGQPILNTVGDPFDPPPEKDATTSMLVVERNEANPDIPNIIDTEDGWSDHVNEDWWNDFPPRSVKIGPLKLPERKYHQLCGLYSPMRYEFEVRRPNWDRVFANQGYRQFDPNGSTQKLQDIVVEGSPISEPAFLDQDGHYLPPPVDKDTIVNLTFRSYKTLDFRVLNMDNLFAIGANTGPGSGTGGGFSAGDGGGFSG